MKQPWFDHSLHPAFRKAEGSSRRAFLGAAAGLALQGGSRPARSEGSDVSASGPAASVSPPKETGIGPPGPPENWEYRPSARTHPSDEHLVPMMNDAIRYYSEKHGVSPTLLTALWGTENQASSNNDETKFVADNADPPHYAITTRASDGSPNTGYVGKVASFFGPYQMAVPAFKHAFKEEFGDNPEKRLRPPITKIQDGLSSDPEMAVDAAARYLNICRKQAEYEAAQLQERGVIVTPRQITLATIHGYNKGPYHVKDANQDSAFSFTGRGKWDYPGRAEENFYRLGGTEREFETAFSFRKSLKITNRFRKSEGLPPAQEPVKRTTRRGMVGPPKIATSAPEPTPPTMKQDIVAAGVETGANFMQRLLARFTGGRVSGSITSDASAPIGKQVKNAGKNILDTIVLGRRKVGQAGAAATGVQPTVLLDALSKIPDPTKFPEMIGGQVGTAVQQHLSRKAQELLQGPYANQHLDPLQLLLNHGESEDIVGSHSLLSYKVYNPKSKRTGTLISGPHGHTLYDPRKLGDGSVWSSEGYPVEQMSEHMKRSDAKSLQGASPWSQVMNRSQLDDPWHGVGTMVADLAGLDTFKETPMITRSLTRSIPMVNTSAEWLRENVGALGEDGVPMGGIKIMWDDGGSDHDPYDDSIGPYAFPDRTPQTVREARKEAEYSGVDPEIRTHDGGNGRIPHPILHLHPISPEQQLTSTIQDLEDIAHGNHGKALEMFGAPAWLKKISFALSQRSLVPLVGDNPLTQMLTNVIKRRINSLQVTTKMNEIATTTRMREYKKQTAERIKRENAEKIAESQAEESAWKQQLAGIVRKMGSMNLAERHDVASSLYPQKMPERVRLPDDYDSLSAQQKQEIRAGQRQRQAEAAAAVEPQNAVMRDRQRTAIYEPYERSVNPFPLQLRLVKGSSQ